MTLWTVTWVGSTHGSGRVGLVTKFSVLGGSAWVESTSRNLLQFTHTLLFVDYNNLNDKVVTLPFIIVYFPFGCWVERLRR